MPSHFDFLNRFFSSGVIFSVAYWNISLGAVSLYFSKNASTGAGSIFQASRKNQPTPWCTSLSLSIIRGSIKFKYPVTERVSLISLIRETGTARR